MKRKPEPQDELESTPVCIFRLPLRILWFGLALTAPLALLSLDVPTPARGPDAMGDLGFAFLFLGLAPFAALGATLVLFGGCFLSYRKWQLRSVLLPGDKARLQVGLLLLALGGLIFAPIPFVISGVAQMVSPDTSAIRKSIWPIFVDEYAPLALLGGIIALGGSYFLSNCARRVMLSPERGEKRPLPRLTMRGLICFLLCCCGVILVCYGTSSARLLWTAVIGATAIATGYATLRIPPVPDDEGSGSWLIPGGLIAFVAAYHAAVGQSFQKLPDQSISRAAVGCWIAACCVCFGLIRRCYRLVRTH